MPTMFCSEIRGHEFCLKESSYKSLRSPCCTSTSIVSLARGAKVGFAHTCTQFWGGAFLWLILLSSSSFLSSSLRGGSCQNCSFCATCKGEILAKFWLVIDLICEPKLSVTHHWLHQRVKILPLKTIVNKYPVIETYIAIWSFTIHFYSKLKFLRLNSSSQWIYIYVYLLA